MKKLSLIINIVLGAAVIGLYVLHFTGKEEKTSMEDLINVTTQISPEEAQIAYVKYDSLLLEYDFYHELSDKLQARKQELETEFGARQKTYEKLLADFNEKVSKGLVTRYKAKEMEEDLLKEQQNLLALRDQLTAKLMEEEQVMNRQLHYSVMEFLKDYNKSKGFQYILSFTFGGPILYSNDALNITQDVIEGINNTYVKQEDKEKK